MSKGSFWLWRQSSKTQGKEVITLRQERDDDGLNQDDSSGNKGKWMYLRDI